MPFALSIAFSSERFDYRSELPEEHNAGNRFYGKDVAAYLSEHLSSRGFQSDYLDEDWGWLVFSARGSPPPDFEIAVYNISENDGGGAPGANRWGLWVRQYQHRKIMGFIPKRSQVAVSEQLGAAIRASVEAAGSNAENWEDGPG
jgi:hypothetical protein